MSTLDMNVQSHLHLEQENYSSFLTVVWNELASRAVTTSPAMIKRKKCERNGDGVTVELAEGAASLKNHHPLLDIGCVIMYTQRLLAQKRLTFHTR